MNITDLYAEVVRRFEAHMPAPQPELHFDTPFQLLVAVMLSAQCTDKRINMVTPALFRAFPDAAAMADASLADVYALIKSVSYPNNKSKALVAMARKLMADHHGIVPHTRDELMALPGVGRKTANVVLAVAFDTPALAVDTHVFRVAARIGLTVGSNNPLETERQLVSRLDAAVLPRAHHWLLLHGRYICTARKPRCTDCFLSDICRSSLAH